MMFGKKERLVEISTPNGNIFVNEVAFNEIQRLKKELHEVKHELGFVGTELKRIKPILEDKRIAPPVSRECEDCKFAVLSPWDRHVVGCRKSCLCEDFKAKENE